MYSFQNAFIGCNSLTSISFPSITTISGGKPLSQEEKIDSFYEQLWHNLENTWTEEEKEKYYTLLKMYNNDYKQTILAIETGK